MIKPTHGLLLFFAFFFQSIFAQEEKDSLRLQFHFKFDNAPLKTNQPYISKQLDTLQIEAFRFYASDIQIQFADGTFLKSDTNHLVDIEIPASQQMPLGLNNKKKIKKIIFSVGVDSLASVSGALSGDLDPAKGMYWAWQSGYINMKIEGKSARCKTRKNQFQFHLGGYLNPYNALRTIALEPKDSNRINIFVDLASFFSEISLSQINSVMIPGKRSMQLSDTSVKMFAVE